MLRPRAAAADPVAPRAARRAARVRVGRIWVDAVTAEQALARVAELVEAGRGGTVFTPNVDHVVLAETDPAFRRAYRRASLAVPDGAPVVWVSGPLGLRLPEKVSGSDLVVPIARLAAARGWGVYLLGGAPGVAEEAARRLHAATGVEIVGVDSPVVSAAGDARVDEPAAERVRRARPSLLLVALGSPKQEVWIDRMRPALGGAVVVGVGAGLDFVAGRQRRAPAFVSAIGFEWLYRLAREPRRLWRRYLVRDPAFVWIAARTRLAPRAGRVRCA